MKDAFAAAAELLGHRMNLEHRAYGRTTHYWITCSCGYESGHGKSARFAVSSGIGHAKRVADRLGPDVRPTRDDTRGESLASVAEDASVFDIGA